MSAPIDLLTTIESAVKTFADGLDRGRTLQTRIVFDDSEQLAAQSSLTASISWVTWDVLGVCGRITLERHVCILTITRREHTAARQRIEEDYQLAQELREHLTGLNATTGRIVDITGPDPFDPTTLTTPGQSKIVLTLDCDILRGRSENQEWLFVADQPLLTTARIAAWNAIQNYPELAGEFTRCFKTDDDLAEIQLRDPSPSELTAIALYWEPISPNWQTNRNTIWPIALTATVWLPGHELTKAERLAEYVIDAFYRATPPGQTAAYIHTATGSFPQRTGPIKIQSVELGRAKNVRALRVDTSFVLRSTKDPFGDT